MGEQFQEQWPNFDLVERSDGAWIAVSEKHALAASGPTAEEACQHLGDLLQLVGRLARGTASTTPSSPSAP